MRNLANPKPFFPSIFKDIFILSKVNYKEDEERGWGGQGGILRMGRERVVWGEGGICVRVSVFGNKTLAGFYGAKSRVI